MPMTSASPVVPAPSIATPLPKVDISDGKANGGIKGWQDFDPVNKSSQPQSGSIMFGAGINSDAGLVGSVVVNEQRFNIGSAVPGGNSTFGDIRVDPRIHPSKPGEAQPGTDTQNYSLSWRDPFTFAPSSGSGGGERGSVPARWRTYGPQHILAGLVELRNRRSWRGGSGTLASCGQGAAPNGAVEGRQNQNGDQGTRGAEAVGSHEGIRGGRQTLQEESSLERSKTVEDLSDKLAQAPKDGEKSKSPEPAATAPPLEIQRPAAQPLAAQHRKIILRSGDMEFEIDSFDASVASIVHLVSSTKEAFVATVNSQKLENGKMRGSVVVRMPPERLDEFVLELRKILGKFGDLKGQNIRSDDVSKKYTDLESELKAHRTMETRLLQIMKDGKGAVKDLLAVEKDLGVYREKIEKIEGELRYYANLAALSTLTITLQEKEIRAAAAYTETERVSSGIEVEDVEKAYQEAQAAIREMKGRISQAEMKQQAAGQFNAKLVFEIAPDQSGPMRDRLRQLGNMVRLEIDRVQKIENGGEPTKDGKIRRGDTEFNVALYNLANVEPRETTLLTLVAADVPAAYQKLRATLAKLKTTTRNATLQEQDKSTVIAVLDFDVRRVDEPAAIQAIEAAGEILNRQATRRAEGDNVTDAKTRFALRILSTAAIEPRETVRRLIAVPDVAAAYRRVQETVSAKEMQGQVRVATLQQIDRNNVTGQLDFVIRSSDDDAMRKLLDELGETLTRKSDRKIGDGVSDAKIRYEIAFIPETSVEARDQVEAKLAATDVPATYRKLRTLVEGLKGQIRGASIQENDRVNIQASLDVVVNRTDEAAVQSALADLGEVLNRTSKRRPEAERVTNSKIEFVLSLVSAAAEIKPRKEYQIEEIVDKVDARLAEFNDAVLKAGGRIVGVPRDEALKSGGARGSVIYEVPLAAVDGIVRRIREATLDNHFVQVVTENASAPEGKLAIARVNLTIATPDFLVARDNGFDPQLRYGLSVALSWLIRSSTWLIAGLVFFLPWVLVIGAIVWLTRLFRRTRPVEPTAPQTPPA